MFDQLDPRSPTPLYEQIAQRVRASIAAGEARPGSPLPSVRQVAADLRVNPATVAQAYRLLEQEGLVVARKGAGTFVKALSTDRRDEERRALARDLLSRMLAEGVHMGLSAADLAEAMAELNQGAEPGPGASTAPDRSAETTNTTGGTDG